MATSARVELDAELESIELTRRLTAAAALGAIVINLLTIAWVWGDWAKIAFLVACQCALLTFNTWVSFRLLSRWGQARTELARGVVNIGVIAATAHVTGWPLPVWFWLPYTAMIVEGVPSVARAIIVGACAGVSGVGLLDGQPWIHPIAFCAIAVFCARLSRVRYAGFRDMLRRSNAQRLELERAHTAIHSANQRVIEEMTARAQVEVELRQAHKLEAVGRLAASIAHEINTPVQFVSDNLQFAQESSADLLRLLEVYRAGVRRLVAGEAPQDVLSTIAAADARCDADYVMANLPDAFRMSRDGLDRIAGIVRSVKEFAHPDGVGMAPSDLNAALRSTLTIARGEYKDVADVDTDLGELPPVHCHLGEINQVILNLIVNASHAIGDVVDKNARRGRIAVRTRADGDDVVISISDTGSGIPVGIRDRIFDPFFTTKEIGRGTGQGLAIGRSVVRKHGGTLTFESTLDVGTTFFIRLPIQPEASPQQHAAAA